MRQRRRSPPSKQPMGRPLLLVVMFGPLLLATAGQSSAVAVDSTATIVPPAAEPAQWIGEDPLLTLRLNDLPRTLQRLASSPYATLEDTPWGRLLSLRMLGRFGAENLDVGRVAHSIRRIALGVDATGGQPGLRWAVETADARPLHQLCEHWLSRRDLSGTLEQRDRLFTLHPPGGPARPGPACPALVPEACLELEIAPDRLLELSGGTLLGNALAGPRCANTGSASPPWTIALSFDPIGICEQWQIPIRPSRPWAAIHLPTAHRDLLTALPADTLCACTFRGEGESLLAALAASGIADHPGVLLAADLVLARLGSPELIDLLGALHGDGVAWVEDGTPMPSATLVVGMDAEMAEQILIRLALGAGMTDDGHGVMIGFLGVCPVQAAYQDGRLILTTHPGGVAGCVDQTPGFISHPDIVAALARIPNDCQLIGVSRSGALTAVLSRLALMSLAHLGVPELSTLPHDLQVRARYGFLAIRQTPEGVNVQAGGLFGGPLTAGLGLASALLYAEVERHIATQSPDRSCQPHRTERSQRTSL